LCRGHAMKIDQFVELPVPLEGQGENSKRSTPQYTCPTKEEVRGWLARVIASRQPPPSINEIQRDLWHMTANDEDGGERSSADDT
jgi:hypothetical protein